MTIPLDDPERRLVVASKNSENAEHLALAGGIYTILVSGEQTNGRYTLIEMRVPPNGGPPPHRHDFEEMFTLLEGELEFTFRGERVRVRAGETVNVPANAPHFFRNVSDEPARMLCMCAPAGQEEYFRQVADPVDRADSAPPVLTEQEQRERRAKGKELAAKYRTEIL
ncbi:cupin domain-containing protein [Amycolatopsis alba]|uniref:Cupin domain-containing protein n=1 Tax=Amycolatopsis alba DSM 44262 TaxID=1125972 RepID=A0A229S3J0_AMYAL|nr:cupin domain-containing protein [Amycolatopsis alba]OXM53466.1 cupin domain-containing protein [Amycolatopsis alba DSM 44262]